MEEEQCRSNLVSPVFVLHVLTKSQRQGCQMVCFHTKNANMGLFFEGVMLIFFVIIWRFGVLIAILVNFPHF
jgi:hypothetical protein